jgi:TctA family transporter
MRLNYRTEPGGSVKVELIQPPGTPPKEVKAVEGFSLAEAEPLAGDELSAVVRWNGSGDLSALAGELLSVRLHLNKAKVFSIAL